MKGALLEEVGVERSAGGEGCLGRGLEIKEEINTVDALSINLIYELFLAETGSYLSKFHVRRGHLVQELDSQPRATVDHLRQIGDKQNPHRRKLSLGSLVEHVGGLICERWPGRVELTEALEPVDLCSNPSCAAWTLTLDKRVADLPSASGVSHLSDGDDKRV